MKKTLSLLFAVFCLWLTARADHITGGEMFYSYGGVSGSEHKYNVTLKLFMRCNSGRMFPDPTIISVFNRTTNGRVKDISVPVTFRETISLTNSNPCITNPPEVCYEVAYYEFSVSLPASEEGYLLSSQVNFRIAGISNLTPGYSQVGATYTAEIPGTVSGADAPANQSAHFTGTDLVIVCANNSMTYSFAAEDKDGDELQYSFCDAYQSGTSGNGAPPPNPPYSSVPYFSPEFDGTSPLGPNVHIDPGTGLISGIAPGEGVYVVTVCVAEVRQGVVIATQRKDLQIKIASCSIAAATLLPAYMLCRNTKTIAISNLSTSPLISTYLWEFVNTQGTIIFSSTNPVVSYTFPDTGIYKIRLAINRGDKCSDSATSIAKVYPGFIPDFNFNGICFGKQTAFTDLTTSVYGVVNSRSWDFGEPAAFDDISDQSNPVYQYVTMGGKVSRLIVTDTKGCKDTALKNIIIIDKPPIDLAFHDTLICRPDAVQLRANNTGLLSWTPLINITNANTAMPVVTPASTTTYYVDLDDNGCKNRDSVKVRVTDHVNLQAMNDTTICSSDTIRLRIVSDGFQYSWTPASQLNDATIVNPLAVTNSSTVYQVTAKIGSCSAAARISVTTVPYPTAFAGSDTVICNGTSAQLNGFSNGASYNWSPAVSLSNPSILNPVAQPGTTTTYFLSCFDTKGCPKPGTDAVVVKVLPDIIANAGRDTTVVTGQPLQLSATGGISYIWWPPIGLSATDIANPVAIYNSETDSVTYRVLCFNEAGCVDSDFVKVKIFKTEPSVFVPTAFTPNADGHNDVLRPIAAGMKKIEYFNVYSRWGQLVFSSSANGSGWDGRIAGKAQNSGTYVWIVKAVDYTGKTYFQKGTTVLIR